MLLLTGFEPFGDFSANPSWDALKFAYKRGLFRVHAAVLQVPCVYASVFDVFSAEVKLLNPQAVVAFGVHGRDTETIYIEQTARNRDGAQTRDNNGVRRGGEPIIEAAPATLPSTLPIDELMARLRAGGFAAETSSSAGNYLCNHLFFRGAEALLARIPFGFIHVPPVQGAGGVMPLERLAAAMALIAQAMAESLSDS